MASQEVLRAIVKLQSLATLLQAKGTPSGLAVLDAGGQLPEAALPLATAASLLALTEAQRAADEWTSLSGDGRSTRVRDSRGGLDEPTQDNRREMLRSTR